MLQSRVRFSSTAALPPTLFLADCIINIAEFEFSTGTGNAFRMVQVANRDESHARKTLQIGCKKPCAAIGTVKSFCWIPLVAPSYAVHPVVDR